MTTLDTIEDLLRDLVGSYTSHPEELLIERKEFEQSGSVYFNLWVHGNDMPTLIGKLGTHVRALALIVSEMGGQHGVIFTLNVHDPKIPREREEFRRVPAAKDYDFANARDLLVRLLVALGLEDVFVEVLYSPAAGLNHPKVVFRIVTRGDDDYGRLVGTRGEEGVGDTSLVGAIGTLFRAYAMKDGVLFSIEVAKS